MASGTADAPPPVQVLGSCSPSYPALMAGEIRFTLRPARYWRRRESSWNAGKLRADVSSILSCDAPATHARRSGYRLPELHAKQYQAMVACLRSVARAHLRLVLTGLVAEAVQELSEPHYARRSLQRGPAPAGIGGCSVVA